MLLLVESRMKLLAFSKTKVLRHHHYLKNFSMLDPQSMVVRDFASSRPLPLTKERKEMLSDILSRIVEDVYSVLDDFLKSKYLLQLQVFFLVVSLCGSLQSKNCKNCSLTNEILV
ncbi:uncharacterized protein LOC107847040 isoform X2 [Capsicum annuum]|uniref:uncharacterized protein LOC107847040 isoform X2 n=1 Tax=Capsicum annuum TaxID=4072 RepID=UPI0007BF3A8A|nr:uncharacterized protein LOC107847040 isoform X2 [Capsicum annuum]